MPSLEAVIAIARYSQQSMHKPKMYESKQVENWNEKSWMEKSRQTYDPKLKRMLAYDVAV